jgi:hypothetical protein
MTNQDYIDQYKNDTKIIASYYTVKDKTGQIINIDGIINPLKIDNRQLCAPTDNQLDTPHCSAFSIANIVEAWYWKLSGKIVNLNADQIYAHAKMLDGDPDSEGTYLEYAIKAAISLCGLDSKNYKTGVLYNDKSQLTAESIKFLIHKFDFVHAGFSINSGWYNASMNDPVIHASSQQVGGHAVLLCGYDQQGVYIQNSWGNSWGAKGFAILPWSDVLKELMYCAYIDGIYNA